MGIYTSFVIPTRSPRLARALLDADHVVLGEDYVVAHDTVKWHVVVGDPEYGPRFVAAMHSALRSQLDSRGLCVGPDLGEVWGERVPPTYEAAIAELRPRAYSAWPHEQVEDEISYEAVWLPTTSSAKARKRYVLLVGVDDATYYAVLEDPASVRSWVNRRRARPAGAPEVRFGPLWVELQRRLYEEGYRVEGLDDERLDVVAPRAGMLLTESRRIDAARLLDARRVQPMASWLASIDGLSDPASSGTFESPRARDLGALLGVAPGDDVDPPYVPPPPAGAKALEEAFREIKAFYAACATNRLGLVAIRYRGR